MSHHSSELVDDLSTEIHKHNELKNRMRELLREIGRVVDSVEGETLPKAETRVSIWLKELMVRYGG